jgi:phosphatidylserine/phosphatidylglycerophosphate/cardiolipin synthase-like enzyme
MVCSFASMELNSPVAVPSYDQRSQQPLLRAGLTCWRVENASRVSVLVDGAAYFHAMKAAMEKANGRFSCSAGISTRSYASSLTALMDQRSPSSGSWND